MSSVECPYHEEEDDRTRENHADQKLGRLGVLAWGSEITLVSCVPAECVPYSGKFSQFYFFALNASLTTPLYHRRANRGQKMSRGKG